MSPRLEIRGQESFGGRATCQLAPDREAFEIFVTDGAGDSYMLVMTAEELYRWAQRRYEPALFGNVPANTAGMA